MSCDLSDFNMNKNGFHISSRNGFFYEASFYDFSVISLFYEVRDKKLSSTFPSLFYLPYSLFPVQFMSSYKAVCGSYKLSTHHNHPLLVTSN